MWLRLENEDGTFTYDNGNNSCSIAGNGGNRTIHGFIDELKVYDVALTPAEVSTEYRSHLNPESVIAHRTMERTEERGGKTYVLDETGRNPLEFKGGAAITTDDPVVGSAANAIATKGRWTHLAVSYDTGCDEGGWWQVTKWYRNGYLVKAGDKR